MKNKTKQNAYGSLGDMMNSSGLNNIISIAGRSKATFSTIKAEDIRILPQQRNADEIENDEQTISELAESIEADGLLQPIVLVANDDDSWRLVCGERRVRACALIGYSPIESLCYESLTEEQIDRIQFAENIHRLNLSQINEAQILQKDIEKYGGIDKVCEIRNKSVSWVSKRLSLLDLPKETTRLLTENITADIEVINTVRQIEKISPEKAAATVIELKENVGKKGVNARETAKKAKDTVKPPKKPKEKPVNPENVAKPKDTSFMDAGEVLTIALDDETIREDEEQQNFEFNDEEPLPLAALDHLFNLVYESGSDPKNAFNALSVVQRDAVEEWLQNFYEAGISCENLANAVVQGFRSGKFANEGHAAFALVAFLNGGEDGMKFNVLNIIGTLKR